jgi:hypothetical protein
MQHHVISLELASDIIADLKAVEDRMDGELYIAHGWHPDLAEITVIEGMGFAVLLCEFSLPELERETGWHSARR